MRRAAAEDFVFKSRNLSRVEKWGACGEQRHLLNDKSLFGTKILLTSLIQQI
jgi:hypothetical protein